MQFEFMPVDKSGKAIPFNDIDVPEKVSIGGREYKVTDRVIDAPIKFEGDLAMHGFKPRSRPSVTISESSSGPTTPPAKAK